MSSTTTLDKTYDGRAQKAITEGVGVYFEQLLIKEGIVKEMRVKN